MVLFVLSLGVTRIVCDYAGEGDGASRLGLPGDCDDKLELADGTVLGPPGTSPTSHWPDTVLSRFS